MQGILTSPLTPSICLPVNFNRFSADSDVVDDGLSDAMADESDDVWMEGNYPRSKTLRNFFPAIFQGTFTM